jgi:hypothetical protein
MRATVDPELDERAVVDQERDPLTRGQLLARVLGLDLVRAASQLDLLAPRPQILGERPQQAGGRGVGGDRLVRRK